MSWGTLNEILSIAATDEDFAQDLLKNPLRTIDSYGYQLTTQERDALSSINAYSLPEFCRQLLARISNKSDKHGSGYQM